MSLRAALLAYRRRWNSWTLPTRAGLLLGLVGLPAFAFSIFAWLYPSLGAEIVASLRAAGELSRADRTEELRKAAAREAIDYAIPSSELLVVKLIRAPLVAREPANDSLTDTLQRIGKFASVSPLAMRATEQVFPGGTCEIWAVTEPWSPSSLKARMRISDVFCRDASGRQFGVLGFDLGFISPPQTLNSEYIELVETARGLELPEGNYLARFRPAIEKLNDFGK